jgi:hypothetical protein
MAASRMRRLPVLTISAFTIGGLVVACSTLESGTIGLITGGDDAGPFNEPPCAEGGDGAFCGPAPTSIVISEVTIENGDGGTFDAESKPTILGKQPYSGGATITLPQISSDDVDILQATAYDSADAAVIFGQTLPVAVGGIDGLTLDLFVQRKGQFAIMPSPWRSPPTSPLLTTMLEGRYILVASQKSSQALLYDMLLWANVENEDGGQAATTLPCTPLSVAAVPGTTFMLLICNTTDVGSPVGCEKITSNASGGDLIALQYDISGESLCTQVTAPSTSTWQSVAGGATVVAPNGDAFIVGGTRSPSLKLGPSSSAFKIGAAVEDAEGGIASTYASPITLNAMREGAVAVWSPYQAGSLVVLGGNEVVDGSVGSAAGVEYVSGVTPDAGTAMTTSTGYAGDPTVGEGAALLDSSHILVAGGTLNGRVAPARVFDLSCGMSMAPCPTQVVRLGGSDAGSPEGGVDEGGAGDGGPPKGRKDAGSADARAMELVPLLAAQGFAEPDASALFIGTESDGGAAMAFLIAGSEVDGGAFIATFAKPVPLRVSRVGATAIQTPIPSVVVVGGSGTMESYIP